MMSSSQNPLISVVMAIYNEPVEWMHQSIDSILNQTLGDFELIIVNDNPNRTENHELINEYVAKDPRVVVLNNDINIGLTKSLNKALRISRGKYIARMDADDIAMPTRFACQVNQLISNSCDLTHSAYIVIDDKGQEKNECVKENITYSNLFLQNQIAHPSVMFKNCLLNLRVNFYDEEIKRSQDYELWTFLYLKGVKFAYDKTPLIRYRISDQQISTKSQTEQWRYSRKSRSRFVISYLHNLGVKLDFSNINAVINKLLRLYPSMNQVEQSNISRVLYLLLYTKVSKNPMAIIHMFKLRAFFPDIQSEYMKLLYKATLRRTKPYLILQDENDN